MNLAIIAAVSNNNVIGNKGNIPWRIPEDMARFKELTLQHPVIMGRNTYESLPPKFKPLPERKNIVLSGSLKNENGIYIARTIEEALELTENKDSYVIGGEKVYNLFLPQANKLEITRVHKEFDGDAFFPQINWNEWSLLNEEKSVSKINGTSYSFLTYSRR